MHLFILLTSRWNTANSYSTEISDALYYCAEAKWIEQLDSELLTKTKSDYFDVQRSLCVNSLEIQKFLFFVKQICPRTTSYRKTQLIILYTNQLHTKTLANLHSGALALTREPHIQTIYLCNVYPFCLSSKIYDRVFFFFTLPISKSWLPEHYKDIYHTVYVFIKLLHPFSKCMNVFNLSEDAVNCCKALIWVSYDPPPYFHMLVIPEGQRKRGRDLGVSRQDLTRTEKANKLQL